jgi:hypothetical protein
MSFFDNPSGVGAFVPVGLGGCKSRGPEGQFCNLSEQGHRILKSRYTDDPRISSWGELHTADAERADVIWRGVKGNLQEVVALAGDPIPLPVFWGSPDT